MEATLSRHMTMEPERDRRRGMSTFLPWIIAAAGLLLYLVTLNGWVVFQSLPHVAKLSGWTWQPERSAPLYWLLTYPLHWLPAARIPLALNIFAAVCAALTLALLARSVMLLPHDRTIAQRERERSEFGLLTIPSAWAPPVLAALVCGLQISFWENATAARSAPPMSPSALMLDLLAFAYVIRCLIEFRISDEDSWLYKASFVYGLAMTNDWAMVGYLPAFLVATVWIKGVAFFNGRFLVKLILWGLAGLLLYLLHPIAQAFSQLHQAGFWTTLKWNLGEQFYILKTYMSQRKTLLVMSFSSLLPVFLMGIRWNSYFGDTSRTGALAARLMFHLVHALFLVVCVWMAFDPPVSPRNQGLGVPFLSFYYLGALAVGYFSGYFLLVFGAKRSSRTMRSTPATPIGKLVTGAVLALVLVVPAGLLALNLPKIRLANGPTIKEYARLLTSTLPSSGVVLSDDVRRLVLAQAWMANRPEGKSLVFIDTSSLPVPEYHAYLRKVYGARWGWNVDVPKQLVPDTRLIELVYNLAQTNQVFYLHPSFGYYFEIFYPEPHGLASQLKLYPEGALNPPPLSEELIRKNQEFWKAAPLETLATHIEGPMAEQGLLSRVKAKLRLKHEVNADARLVASYYAQAQNFWGVQLQRNGNFAEAGPHFQMAHKLNPDNLVARVNAHFNERYLAGQRELSPIAPNIEDEFGRYRSWTAVINANGPFDDPAFSYNLGLAFAQGKNYRQAAQNFERSRVLAPNSLAPYLGLGEMLIRGNRPAESLELLKALYSNSEVTINPTNRAELLVMEATAHLMMTNFGGIAQAASKAVERWPEDEIVARLAVELLMRSNSHTNALTIVNSLLKRQPEDLPLLINRGVILMQLGKLNEALGPLSQAVELAGNSPQEGAAALDQARINRAVVYLRMGRLDEAKADYQALQGPQTNSFRVHYGLGEIAFKQNDKVAAIRHYESYLTNSPTDSAEIIATVRQRLEQLKQGSP